MIEALLIGIVGLGIFSIPFLILHAVVTSLWKGVKALKRRSDQARQRRRQELAHARARLEQRQRDDTYQRAARVREAQRLRERQAAAIETQRQQVQLAAAQRRRNDARAKCECRWSLYERHIRLHYSRSGFERFMRTFMTDGHAADEVEARAAQLVYILDTHYASRTDEEQARQFKTLEDVTGWFVEQRERIGRLPIDEQTREEHQARLQAVYAELSARVLETPS